jgi:hypothetical protein
MWNRITRAWCQAMHQRTMWPIHGKYTCTDCLREYPVQWEAAPRAAADYAAVSASIDVCA